MSNLDPLTIERPRLLIVDDQPINIQTLYEIFADDHEVFMATSGQQALDFCRDNPPPDLILLDIIMPGMDGLEVCPRLKADPFTSHIPIIFVTAQSDPADETHAIEAGGVDFISKPINTAVVRVRVKTHLTLKVQTDMLRSLAFVDGLTGLANRRRFDDALENEWRRCRRSNSPLSLMMIDLDYFKRYNDYYGHQMGDVCLQRVAKLLKASFKRASDLTARYGGEEFVCLMAECDHLGAQKKAEELRAVVEELGIEHAESPVARHVTLSIGVSTVVPDNIHKPDALIAAADAALYEAKNTGRNRVGYRPVKA